MQEAMRREAMGPTREADKLARRISMDQAHAHAERHMQRAVDNLVYWATRMVERIDRGEVVTGEARDNLVVALHEARTLSQAETPEAVGWWIGRYLERKAAQLELPIADEGSPPTQVEQAALTP
jgi:hypothetical protein